MNAAEFLKPNLSKVIIFILIFALVPFPYFLECRDDIFYIFCVDKWTYLQGWVFIRDILLLRLSILLEIASLGPYVLLYLATSYIVSCVVYWVYQKIRKG